MTWSATVAARPCQVTRVGVLPAVPGLGYILTEHSVNYTYSSLA